MVRKKIELEEVKKEFIKRGYKPLFDVYNNNREKLLSLTKEGYKIVISLNKLKLNRTPSEFGNGNPYTIENIELWVSMNEPTYTLLSKSFIDAGINKLIWKCNDDHEFNMTWADFKKGARCPFCYGNARKTTEQFKQEVYNLVGDEYEVLGEYINTSTCIKLIHNKCGHVYKVSPRNFLNGARCTGCNIKRLGENNHRWNPNLTDKERQVRYMQNGEIRKWSKKILERDNYTCQRCGQYGGDLRAHHLDGWNWCKEKRFDIDNGVTLCSHCHDAKYKDSFHSVYKMGANTKKQYQEWLRSK